MTESKVRELMNFAIKTKTESFGIDPLNGKYYYTSLSNKDGIIKLTLRGNYPSSREIENGWSRDEDGMDHVETDNSYNLALFISECSPQNIIALCTAYLDALEVIKIIDLNFKKITKCPDNPCDGCHEDAKIASEIASKALKELE